MPASPGPGLGRPEGVAPGHGPRGGAWERGVATGSFFLVQGCSACCHSFPLSSLHLDKFDLSQPNPSIRRGSATCVMGQESCQSTLNCHSSGERSRDDQLTPKDAGRIKKPPFTSLLIARPALHMGVGVGE